MSTMELSSYVPPTLDVRVEPLLRIQGYRDIERVRPRIRTAAEQMRELAASVFEPEVRYRESRIRELTAEALLVEPGVTLCCPAFAHFLRGADRVVVFVLTVGPRFDQALQTLQDEERLMEAVLLDTAGWLGVESVAKQFATFLRARAARASLKLTRRLAPGYSFKVAGRLVEWPLEDQVRLFEVLGDEPLPVTLMESSAMLPRMSRSGLFGLARRGGACLQPAATPASSSDSRE